jgi:uncharacterized phiE125 gp8 family phage protein
MAVTLAEIKTFLRVDSSLEDAELTAFAKAAITRIEKYIDHKLITQTWEIHFDRFPCSGSAELDSVTGVVDASRSVLSGRGVINLPFGKVQSITSFETIDNDDVVYTYPASQFSVDTKSYQGRLALKLGSVWPATVLRPVNGIRIVAVVGYGLNPSDVPEEIRQAILLTVSKLYENRGDGSNSEFFGFAGFTLPNTAMMLLEPFRKIKL